jgi:lipopolysaccharide export system permease protein
MFAVFFAAVNLVIVGFAQPYSRFQYERLRFELRSGALGASIKVGEFTNLGKRMTLRIEKSENDGRDLTGIFVRAEDKKGKSLAVTAEKGTFMATDDPDTIILRLTRGTLIHDAPQYKAPRILTFDNHDLPIDLPKIEAFRSRGGKDRELTMPELVKIGTDKTKPKMLRDESLANFHFRLVEVAMMLLLPMLAVALAVPPKRSSSGLGVFLSIVMVVTYHKINEYAESMGSLGKIDPFFALWIPFALFAALIWWMYHTLAHKPGGQPIGALERVFAKIAASVRGLFRLKKKAAD